MTSDFLDRLEAAMKQAPRQQPRRPPIRCVPRPRQEISDALLRCKSMLVYYEPSLQDLKLTTLYEYAAQRLLRDCIPDPRVIVADCLHYRTHYQDWWEEWRKSYQPP